MVYNGWGFLVFLLMDSWIVWLVCDDCVLVLVVVI